MGDSGLAGVTLKRLKEEFVSNLHGSSMLEIAALSAVVPAFILLRQIGGLLVSGTPFDLHGAPLQSGKTETRTQQPVQKGNGRDDKVYTMMLVKDFMCVCVPTLACLTVLADWVYSATAITFGLTLAGTAYIWRKKRQGGLALSPLKSGNDTHSRKLFLSSFRSTMMLVTCVCILGVDFNVFPRRYAKTEVYGTGLMDIGVGSFVVANGLVSRQARNLPPLNYGGVVRNTSPLLVLGFSRLILTKGVDYQEHVAEYGVHWNFFFTLAAVALLTSLIDVPVNNCGFLGVIILGVYQGILSFGLSEYLLSSDRGPSLISLNKEGIFSILGYWSIYLISVQLGHYLCCLPNFCLNKRNDVSTTNKREGTAVWWIAVDVWLLDAIFWVITIVVDEFIERVSRRTCNLAYVTFVFAINLEIIAIFLTADLFLLLKPILLLRVFDRNLLATFLWGNILTGLVNMSTDTISTPFLTGFIILLGYLATVVGGMAVVDSLGLKLKCW